MKRLLPLTLAAFALAACQGEPPAPAAQAEAQPNAIVATAVGDVRAAAIDPATGKHRDGGEAFVGGSDNGAAVAPAATLGGVAAGAPSPTFQLQPGTIIVDPATQAGN